MIKSRDIPELVLLILLDSPFLRPSSATSLLHASPLLWRISTNGEDKLNHSDFKGKRPNPLLGPSSSQGTAYQDLDSSQQSSSSEPDSNSNGWAPTHTPDGIRTWRRRLVLDFPWFVFDGLCEGHAKCPVKHVRVPPESFKVRHRLPSSPRLAHLKIVRGGLSLICQVINSETPTERMQSVCFALVTFQPYLPPAVEAQAEPRPGPEQASSSSNDPAGSSSTTVASGTTLTYTPSSSTSHRPPANPTNTGTNGASRPIHPWHLDDCFLVNYDPANLARSGYHPMRVALPGHPTPAPFEAATLHEPFTVTAAALQFRRVPDELANWDPRELWFREIWDRKAKFGGPERRKISDRGTHALGANTPAPPVASSSQDSQQQQTEPTQDLFPYPPGTPIEVQWFQPSLFLRRNDQLDFWHGRVLLHNPANHSIVIEFPQYKSQTDLYRRVVADDRGMLREGVAGMCGGVREVRCAREKFKWEINFAELDSGGGEVPEGLGVAWELVPGDDGNQDDDDDDEEDDEDEDEDDGNGGGAFPANLNAQHAQALAELLELAMGNPQVQAALAPPQGLQGQVQAYFAEATAQLQGLFQQDQIGADDDNGEEMESVHNDEADGEDL